MQQQDFLISARGRENWRQEKGEKVLQLKQMESKSFHLAREVKHRARQHAQEVASIKYQLHQLQQLIEQREQRADIEKKLK